MVLPREILERVDRVADYHASSKHTYQSVRGPRPPLDWANHPSPYRTFASHPKMELPRATLDTGASTLSLLAVGVHAVPAERLHPPQDLATLANWLYLADGVTAERALGGAAFGLRTCPSCGACSRSSSTSPRSAWRGWRRASTTTTCASSRRPPAPRRRRDVRAAPQARPDLDFLKTVPAALLVSTVFCRASWKFRQRGYRYALDDAGHLIQNLITAANGLGIGTTTRLRHARQVAARADRRAARGAVPRRRGGAGDGRVGRRRCPADRAARGGAGRHGDRVDGGWAPPLPAIARPPLAASAVPFGSILAVHADCVAPGVAIRDVRPPLTELSPLPPDHALADLPEPPPLDAAAGQSLRGVMLNRRSTADFKRVAISRDALWTINRLAFRGGTFFPIFPGGAHVGLVRPVWVVHDVDGMEAGVWYYDPPTDRWHLVRAGEFRIEAKYVSLEQQHLCAQRVGRLPRHERPPHAHAKGRPRHLPPRPPRGRHRRPAASTSRRPR